MVEARHEKVDLFPRTPVLLFTVLWVTVDFVSDEGLLKVGVGVKHQGEVMHCRHLTQGLLVDVPGLLEVTQTDEMVGQRAPQPANLVSESLESAANDGFYCQRFDLLRVLGYQVTQVHPELVVGFALHRREALVVDDLGEQPCGLVKVADRYEVGDVGLNVVGLQHQVTAEHTHGRLYHAHVLDEVDVPLPDPVMLCDWECPECSVVSAPRARDEFLFAEEVGVLDPDLGHLVEEDQGPLEAHVDAFVPRVGDAVGLDLLHALAQIDPPQLV
mmetsp:Transcript_19802/g.48014  ORF Transcript_19802/g.48014 Transcript_19802/m.48014 type:complete len:272 (-) Transcript_19802:374-1189(-)